MQVVVTGGTGFIGKRLVKKLIERGDSVTVLTRGDAALGAGHAKSVTWDPRPGKDTAWMSAIDGADAVVHLAGAGVMDERWTDERLAIIRSSRTDSTRLVAEAIVMAKKRPKVFLSSSAVGIYGMQEGDRVFDEDSSQFGTDVLAEVCKEWESSAAAAEKACRVVHTRIGVVLGKEEGALAQFLPAFRAFVGGPVGSGKQWLSWIHWQDTVDAIVRLIDDESLRGPINIVGPNPCTMRQFADTLGKVLGRPSFFRVPDFAARIVVGRGAEVVLTGQRVLPKRLLAAEFAYVHPDLTECLQTELGHR
ncbi:TIGR01777 family oxidoreductase [soil metagenome]